MKAEDKEKLIEDFKQMPSEVADALKKHMPQTETSEADQGTYIQALRIHTLQTLPEIKCLLKTHAKMPTMSQS